MASRLVLIWALCLPLLVFADEYGNPTILTPGIYIPIPVINVPSSPNITVTNPMILAYIANQEQRAKDILEDENGTITSTWTADIPLAISGYGINISNPYLGGCGHLSGIAPDYPVLTIEGNGDKLCLLGKPEYREPADIDDIWILLPNGDLQIYPDASVSTTINFSFMEGFLTDAEEELCLENLPACYLVGVRIPDANMAATACEFNPQDDGIANAILHATWSALVAQAFQDRLLMSKQDAIALAREFTNAHEEVGGVTCQNAASGTSEHMDCANNETGLDIFADNSFLDPIPLMVIVYTEMQLPGKATVIINDSCTTWW